MSQTQILAVCSFKGGTAKTSTTLNLGAVLAKEHKKKVLVLDLDPQANLTLGLGYDPDTQDSLAPVLQNKKQIEDVILSTSLKNLFLIPADTWLERVEVTEALASDRYSHEKLKHLLSPLTSYDFILIDTPPSLCWLTESALIAADYALIATTPEFYSLKGMQRLAEFIDTLKGRHRLQVLGVLLSFWNERGQNNSAFVEMIENTFPGKLLQEKIRRDAEVAKAAIHGKPLIQTSAKSRAVQDYQALGVSLLKRLRSQQKTKV